MEGKETILVSERSQGKICPECKGHRKITQYLGSFCWDEKCELCQGRGTIPPRPICPKCNGDGKVKLFLWWYQKCEFCQGKGIIQQRSIDKIKKNGAKHEELVVKIPKRCWHCGNARLVLTRWHPHHESEAAAICRRCDTAYLVGTSW